MKTQKLTPMSTIALGLALGLSATFWTPSAEAACAVSDVTFEGENADSCVSAKNGNDSEDNLNFVGDWTFLAKWDKPSTYSSGSIVALDESGDAIATITFSLDGGDLINNEYWEFDLNWVYAPIAQSALIPVTMDLIFTPKQGQGFAQYLFAGEVISIDALTNPPSGGGEGTFKITFQCNAALGCSDSVGTDFSHLAVYGQVSNGGGGPPQQIPEPGSLALLGGALFGLWAVRRRKEV